jgi:hypothetical protein
MNRYWLAAAGTFLVVAGCSATVPGTTEPASQTAPDTADGTQPRAAERSGADGSAAEQQDRREVIRTASLTVVADDPSGAADRVAQIAGDLDGYVESLTSGGDCMPVAAAEPAVESCPPGTPTGGAGMVSVTVRIPAPDYDDALARIREVAQVRSLETGEQDVTGTTADLDARISAQRASVERLLRLLQQADSVSDVIAVEREVATRQAELESLQAQRKRLADSVALATISVTVVSPDRAEQIAPDEPRWWDRPWDAFWITAEGMLLAAAAVAPLLLVAGAVAGLAVWVVRRRRRTPPAARTTPVPAGTKPPPGAEERSE